MKEKLIKKAMVISIYIKTECNNKNVNFRFLKKSLFTNNSKNTFIFLL